MLADFRWFRRAVCVGGAKIVSRCGPPPREVFQRGDAAHDLSEMDGVNRFVTCG